MSAITPDQRLDLGGVTCPGNFVRAKLKLEQMEAGQTLEIIIDDGDPVKNVPRSIKEEGHQILEVEKVGDKWKLIVKKA